MRTFFADLTGANCRLGGQALTNLQATEDIDADYDTGSAVSLAPGGPFTKGQVVQTVEGGVSTGYWVVEDPVVSRSGSGTWRRRQGAAGYAHVPLVSYRLRRKGYLQARATLSRVTIGADHYPPKFCTMTRWAAIIAELQHQLDRPPRGLGTIDSFEFMKQRGAWIPVWNAEYIIAQICRWVGLSYQIKARLDCCADEYQPVDKPAMTALREVASWSGRSVFLDRNGVVNIFDWPEVFGRGGGHPWPAALLEEEMHDSLYPVSHVTVVGSGYTPGLYRKLVAVEVTETAGGVEAAHPVVERIEIHEYPITPTIAQRIARERLARVAIGGGISMWRGPAEGCQSMRPLASTATRVTRSLNWNGKAYRYEMEISAPRSMLVWRSGGWNATGWW